MFSIFKTDYVKHSFFVSKTGHQFWSYVYWSGAQVCHYLGVVNQILN